MSGVDIAGLVEQVQVAAEITGDELLQAAADALLAQAAELAEARRDARNADGDLYRDLWKASSKNVGRVCGTANRLRDQRDEALAALKASEEALRIEREVAREDVAKIVYAAMKWAAERAEKGKPPEWVERGNSLAQMEARRFAADIVSLPRHGAADRLADKVEDLMAEFGTDALPMIGDWIGEWRHARRPHPVAGDTLDADAGFTRLRAMEAALRKPFSVLFLDGRNDHGAHVLPSLPTNLPPDYESDLAEQAETIMVEAERLGFKPGEDTVWSVWRWNTPQYGDEGRVEFDGYWEFVGIDVPMSEWLRAKSALENGPAGLADATNNPPSDPGTEQREAGV